jgi:sigma-B regulation protein RsbU (phosphoserine phosphatase)
MASVHTLVRSIASAHCGVAEVLARANSVLVDTTEGDRFVTLLFALLDPRTRSLTYASAGHPTGFVLDASGRVKDRLASTGLPLGILRETEFAESDPVLLKPGDLVLMFTDGIQEVHSPQGAIFGTDRALEVVRQNQDKAACEIIERLYRATYDFSGGKAPTDDVTAMVIKVEPAPQENCRMNH